ncbi:chlorohydrolase [Candidatus Bathyarchaeota archaeon]|nr:MAG: chlorohydrolase [Candidatus Bathyarchaeota archaeon]
MIVFEKTMILAGKDLKLIKDGYIAVENGKIFKVGFGTFKGSAKKRINAKGFLVIPGFINAHVHLGDSAAKELGFGKKLLDLMKPPNGLKHKFLRKTNKKILVSAIRSTLKDMLTNGITTFVDFREEGINGIKILKKALDGLKINSIILGRPKTYMDEKTLQDNLASLPDEALKEALKILDMADGIGLSSPNEYTDKALQQFSKICKNRKNKKLLATHVAESLETKKISQLRTGCSEVYRAVKWLKPDFLIHLTHPSEEDLQEVSKRKIGVVVCPKANSIMGVGFPPIKKFLKEGLVVALGTDNVMVNQPNMFEEMRYLLMYLNVLEKNSSTISLKEIFKMATQNGAKILGLDDVLGIVDEGKNANLVFVDFTMDNLAFSHDILASLILRGRPENVKLVMVEGEIVLDRVGWFKIGR